MEKKGALFLIPSTIGESNITTVIPSFNKEIIATVKHYIVENEKAARHFLKKIDREISFEDINLYPLNKHTHPQEIKNYLNPIFQGKNVGIISEAGCPAIADPGAVVVSLAHKNSIKVVPLVGPSSITLALMASGFNGQNFTFLGYLPKEPSQRTKKIKELEKSIYKNNQTQIFIETPYRNMHLLRDITNYCDKNTLLCIATDITLPTESIITKKVSDWKTSLPDINKKPSVFLLYKEF